MTSEFVNTVRGSDLRAWRLRVDYTQGEAARLIGVSETTWARWEREEATPNGAHLSRLFGLLLAPSLPPAPAHQPDPAPVRARSGGRRARARRRPAQGPTEPPGRPAPWWNA